jgi:adenosylcobinamide-phosphate synthase
MLFYLVTIPIAFLLDLLIGDPRCFYHPVCFIGAMITRFEALTRHYIKNEYIAGTVTVILVCGITVSLVLGFMGLGYWVYGVKGMVIIQIMGYYFGFSIKALKQAAYDVINGLKSDGIEGGRKTVAMLVSRETSQMNEEQVCSSTIESVAENSVDGIIAPMFFAAIGGVPLLWLYKAISTCDSMIGYKNETYMKFGRFAAKLDDVVNYIPARIGLIILSVSALFVKLSPRDCLLIALRDAKYDDSPNSGLSEAGAAGALQCRLGGTAIYDGEIHKKTPFGEEFPSPTINDIKRMVHLMLASSFVTLGAVILFRVELLRFLSRDVPTFFSLLF